MNGNFQTANDTNFNTWTDEEFAKAWASADARNTSALVDEYINEQSEDVRPLLRNLRVVIRFAAPNAQEKISWRMPTFWQRENLIHFAAFKSHIGIYPGGEASTFFAERLTGYKTGKGTIQLPLGKAIDYDLVSDITKWRVAAATVEGIV